VLRIALHRPCHLARSSSSYSFRNPSLAGDAIVCNDGMLELIAVKSFFAELKRRKSIALPSPTAVALVAHSNCTQVFPFFEIPDWAVRLIVARVGLVFPIALTSAVVEYSI